MPFLHHYLKAGLAGIGLVLFFSIASAAQGNAAPVDTVSSPFPRKNPTIKQIDFAGLRRALTPSRKPLLINFWATWCDPCREEFPDLVKLDAEYRGKIDFITISLDELSEINRDVPRFLAEMNAGMPAYLLKTKDDDAAIAFVSKDWSGALPLTILYDPMGKQIYYRQGKVKLALVRAEIDKMIKPAN